MKNSGITNGVSYGIAAIILTMTLYFVDHRILLSYGSWISLLIAAYFMYKAAITTRESQDGFISFGGALNPSFLTWVIGSFLSSVFSYILFNFIDASLLDTLMDIQMEAMDKLEGFIGEDQVEIMKEAMEEKGGEMGIGTVFLGWMTSLLIPGIILAMIVSLIVKRKDNNTFA